MTPVAQAADWVRTGPVRWYSMETRQPAIEGESAGMANGLTKRGPFVRSVSAPMVICSMPPPPVLMITAPRSSCSGDMAAKSMPESATASLAAATAKWMKRLMRRAILWSMAALGSKSLTSAAMRTSRSLASKWVIGPTPETPPARLRQ